MPWLYPAWGATSWQNHQSFLSEKVTVIGIHTVFENHVAMPPAALRVFLHEFRVKFPVAVDSPDPTSKVPVTMHRYQMRGTPSLVIIDRARWIRVHQTGKIEDMTLGSAIQTLVDENA